MTKADALTIIAMLMLGLVCPLILNAIGRRSNRR